jgi:hypothetical protein
VFSLNEFGGLRRIKSNDLDSGFRQNDGFDKYLFLNINFKIP